jgi:hypothetical protein
MYYFLSPVSNNSSINDPNGKGHKHASMLNNSKCIKLGIDPAWLPTLGAHRRTVLLQKIHDGNGTEKGDDTLRREAPCEPRLYLPWCYEELSRSVSVGIQQPLLMVIGRLTGSRNALMLIHTA